MSNTNLEKQFIELVFKENNIDNKYNVEQKVKIELFLKKQY